MARVRRRFRVTGEACLDPQAPVRHAWTHSPSFTEGKPFPFLFLAGTGNRGFGKKENRKKACLPFYPQIPSATATIRPRGITRPGPRPAGEVRKGGARPGRHAHAVLKQLGHHCSGRDCWSYDAPFHASCCPCAGLHWHGSRERRDNMQHARGGHATSRKHCILNCSNQVPVSAE